MTGDAENQINLLRVDLNRSTVEKRQKEAQEVARDNREHLIEEAQAALDFALRADQIQEDEIASQVEAGDTMPYIFKFHTLNSGSDEDLGFEEGIIQSDTVSVRMASDPLNPKTGNELVLYFPLPAVIDDEDKDTDTDTLHDDDTTTASALNTEFYALKKIKHPSGDYDEYYYVWPDGVLVSTKPSRKIKDQITDFHIFMNTVDPLDFEQSQNDTTTVSRLRDDLVNMKLVWHKEDFV